MKNLVKSTEFTFHSNIVGPNTPVDITKITKKRASEIIKELNLSPSKTINNFSSKGYKFFIVKFYYYTDETIFSEKLCKCSFTYNNMMKTIVTIN